MLHIPFPGWPSFTREEADAVSRVLMSNKVNYWTGDECRTFEKEFAAWVGTTYAVALANGTVALDLALKAIKIGPGDEVVVTPRTFIASVSCVVNAGAKPVFADVDPQTGNLSAETIAAVLTPRTRAIICVHLGGWACDMDPIMELAKKHRLKVIEDCAQAHGARYKGRSVGSIGHIGAWSFCQDKIMTTGGEGGMVTTNDESLWRAMWAYKDHGKSYAAVYQKPHPPGFRWLHESFGTNWRMTEIQAAIGRIQLRRMNQWSLNRRQNAAQLTLRLAPFSGEDGPLRLPRWECRSARGSSCSNTPCTAQCVHAWYRFYAYIRPNKLKPDWNRDRLIDEINARGVPCYQGACSEVYLERAFDGTGFRPAESLPAAKELGTTSLMFLVHPSLSQTDINETADVVCSVLSEATRK